LFFKRVFTKLISNVIYVSTNKDSQVFSAVSTIHLAKKLLKGVASFHLFQSATKHCVAGFLLTASYGLTEPNVFGIAASLRAGQLRNRGSISGWVKKFFSYVVDFWVTVRRNA
jgi:hypothetical protein